MTPTKGLTNNMSKHLKVTPTKDIVTMLVEIEHPVFKVWGIMGTHTLVSKFLAHYSLEVDEYNVLVLLAPLLKNRVQGDK